MILNEQERARLQELITSPDFEILLKFAQELKKHLAVAEVYNLTEWDYIKGSLQREYQVKFVDEFFRLLEEEAQGGSDAN